MNPVRNVLLSFCFAFAGWSQQSGGPDLDDKERSAVIDQLASKLSAGYVLPDAAPKIVQALRAAQQAGEFTTKRGAQEFAEALNRTLAAASHDKHLKVYYDALRADDSSMPRMPDQPRERFNFGFNKLERLKGNIGYLEILSFQPVDRASDTARDFLGALAGFDAIILDLRKNGGGNTPMVALAASYFFGTEPVHLTDIYWRDTNKTVELWTAAQLPGRRSEHQPLYILTSASTFSGAEDFTYSLRKLNRATIVGERTGGGAHTGRGLQRLSPLFTAFVPVGRSINPVTKTNWEGVGIEPDIETTADQALGVAHLAALRRLAEKESDEQWKRNLQSIIQQLSAQ